MADSIIICIGNALAADDGAGWRVYQELSLGELSEKSIDLRFLGLGGIDLLEELGGERQLIVVDAVQLGAQPGTVHCLNWDQLPEMTLRPVSGHGIGVREAIEVGRRLYPQRVPENIFLVGIEGKCFDQLGEGLTPLVEAAVPVAVAEVVRLVNDIEDVPTHCS